MYIVEGNIGAGKTTFLNLIKNNFPKLNVVLEPIHSWQDQVSGQSLLGNFYHDPKRWAYTLETLAMIYRTRDHIEHQKNENQTTIIERSIYSGHYCFAYNSYTSNFLTDTEWEIYKQWFDFLISKKCKRPAGFIYLKLPPETSYKRIQKRNRAEEKELGFEYIEHVHNRHEEFLIQKKNIAKSLKGVPVLTIDCNRDFEHDKTQRQKHFDALELFLMQTLAKEKTHNICANI